MKYKCQKCKKGKLFFTNFQAIDAMPKQAKVGIKDGVSIYICDFCGLGTISKE